MKAMLASHRVILMEAAVVEQLRRSGKVSLHPTLLNAPLIYDGTGRSLLHTIYQEYIDLAVTAKLPILICSPTWRANQARVFDSTFPSTINTDAVQFLQELRNNRTYPDDYIKIGGLIGCKYDSYRPEQGLSTSEAVRFHGWQVNQLAKSGVDFLLAATLPSINEAVGIAKAMESTGIPYILSFVIGNSGCLLDGTALSSAIAGIDSATIHKPLGFMINCAYPRFLCADRQPADLFSRLIGYQANASALSHEELEGATHLKSEPVPEWGEAMIELHNIYGMQILGGCCGTGVEHLKYLVDRLISS